MRAPTSPQSLPRTPSADGIAKASVASLAHSPPGNDDGFGAQPSSLAPMLKPASPRRIGLPGAAKEAQKIDIVQTKELATEETLPMAKAAPPQAAARLSSVHRKRAPRSAPCIASFWLSVALLTTLIPKAPLLAAFSTEL